MESMCQIYTILMLKQLSLGSERETTFKVFLSPIGTSSSMYVPKFVSQYPPREEIFFLNYIIFSEFGFALWDT